MRIRVNQISVPLDYSQDLVRQRLAGKVWCPAGLLSSVRVIRRSLDARERNPQPVYVLSAEAELALDRLPDRARVNDIEIIGGADVYKPVRLKYAVADSKRPLVVGAGPAGLMAALELALGGARPVLIDRGDEASRRAGKVGAFWNDGVLDPESNVLFGEGGAGLFSDGKLTARTKDRGRVGRFFRHLVDCGADPDILIDAEPHIGSDHLLNVVPEIRRRIIENGGDVRFGVKLTDIHVENGRICGAKADDQEIECSACILAVGHSARDVYEMLVRCGVALEAKPFAVGVRLEVPQKQIDKSQYGGLAGDRRLPAASFRLTRRAEGEARACYSFCMCPGGQVISCASEPDRLTTNGMSFSQRSLSFGNAAFLVPVEPSDFGEAPLAGIEFQRKIESKAFALAGGGYNLPAVRLVDFLKGRVSDIPEKRSCGRAVPAELREVLPGFVVEALVKAVPPMIKLLRGVKIDDIILYGPETRSSAPLRVVRSGTGESISCAGLYPAGEGAGYAGGIVSSAIDGMKQAEFCMAMMAAG